MATDFINAGYAVTGGDIPFKNYGGSAIGAGLAVKLDTSNGPSGIDNDVPGVVVTTNDTDVIGITVESIPASGVGRVRVLGAAKGTAGAAISFGDLLMSAASGKVVAQTAGKFQCGRALNAAAADGDPVTVLLTGLGAKNA